MEKGVKRDEGSEENTTRMAMGWTNKKSRKGYGRKEGMS
jgi:hypothetical protein